MYLSAYDLFSAVVIFSLPLILLYLGAFLFPIVNDSFCVIKAFFLHDSLTYF